MSVGRRSLRRRRRRPGCPSLLLTKHVLFVLGTIMLVRSVGCFVWRQSPSSSLLLVFQRQRQPSSSLSSSSLTAAHFVDNVWNIQQRCRGSGRRLRAVLPPLASAAAAAAAATTTTTTTSGSYYYSTTSPFDWFRGRFPSTERSVATTNHRRHSNTYNNSTTTTLTVDDDDDEDDSVDINIDNNAIHNNMAPPKKKFYVVAAGRAPGIYTSWPQAEAQVKGFSKAKFKGFLTHEAAQEYWQTFGNNNNGGGGGGGGAAGTSGAAVTAPTAAASVQNNGKRSASASCSTTHLAAAAAAAASGSSADNNRGGKKSRLEKREELKVASSSSSSSTENEQHHNGSGSRRLEFDIHFDGGARGNPGVAGAGTHIVEKHVETTTVRAAAAAAADAAADADASSRDKAKGNYHKTVTTERSKTDIRTYLGPNSTNNQAEYMGAIGGLQHVLETLQKDLPTHDDDTNDPSIGAIKVSLLGDSNLVIQHLLGSWSCKSPKLVPLLRRARGLVQDLKALAKASNVSLDVTFGHVYREDNKIADALANEAMDERQSWTTTSADMEFHALGSKDDKADTKAQKPGGSGGDSDEAYL